MTAAIRAAGFTNIHEDLFKTPIGAWPKDARLKEVGRVNGEHWSSGLEGFGLFLLTKYGSPKPWSKEEVIVYVAGVRRELAQRGVHIYHYS